MGLDVSAFDEAIASFRGAARRLEPLHHGESFTVFRDFAHAPSKVKATVNGVKASYPDRELTAVLELHTFSSLNKDFLPTYSQAMASADEAVVFYDPAVLAHKKLPPLDPQFVADAFGSHPNLRIITVASELHQHVQNLDQQQRVVLLMSSGWFGNAEWSW
jgi:UDP-N-acetylmuramate: L-alanyl-gamma-D-glutamyl-meso-diaminopimelate ligase